MKYSQWDLKDHQVQDLVNQDPTPLEILDRQFSWFCDEFQSIQAWFTEATFGNRISGAKTLLAKLNIALFEPNLTPKMKRQIEEMESWIKQNIDTINTTLAEISRKSAQTLERRQLQEDY